VEYHFATTDDLDLLAEWNRQLIGDEGHRNTMSLAELRERMEGWLAGEYRAAIFGSTVDPRAYALFSETDTQVYLRQFFVRPDCRNEGTGRCCIETLRNDIWPDGKRLTVEVLIANPRAVRFWREVGFQDYSLMLEILP
jgi:GNAT superfamily N-acetyltransferase